MTPWQSTIIPQHIKHKELKMKKKTKCRGRHKRVAAGVKSKGKFITADAG